MRTLELHPNDSASPENHTVSNATVTPAPAVRCTRYPPHDAIAASSTTAQDADARGRGDTQGETRNCAGLWLSAPPAAAPE
ncbi:hypothetical protein GCM10009764_10970 [Nocardia ninae]|uniref:Uncharacterized protein n=1 Tax=Nocardia ninae NBRC 108245 TaxID=1210091 RepID=A0A511MT65_9NOCA|nr:hypothetical protein NN4_77650 [Nocardia ninae NBRC 108245]